MSAESVLHAVVTGCLAGVAGLNRIEPGASGRATPPFAEVGPVVASDWGTKDAVGREVRLTVTVRDLAERAERLHGLSGGCQAAVEGIARELSGWRIASLSFVRSRTASGKAGLWEATIEWRVRMLAG